MKPSCELCWSLETHAHTMPVSRLADPLNAFDGGFASLRPTTRLRLFSCAECGIDWKWSGTRGWHHDGQRHAKSPLVVLRRAQPAVPVALPIAA